MKLFPLRKQSRRVIVMRGYCWSVFVAWRSGVTKFVRWTNNADTAPLVRSYRIRPATWLHEGSPVDMITIDTRTEMSGTGHRYIGDSTTAALHIDNVRLEDDGVWGCTLEDDRGKILFGKPVKLVVLGKYLTIFNFRCLIFWRQISYRKIKSIYHNCVLCWNI